MEISDHRNIHINSRIVTCSIITYECNINSINYAYNFANNFFDVNTHFE